MLKKVKRTILVVDDDLDYLFQMRSAIQDMGFEVITAATQKEAENIIERTKPDLAILDLMMESQDTGFILCHIIKNKYPGVPIIIASAVTAETGMIFDVNTQEDQDWIKADLFLDKGIRNDQLHKEINKLLKI
ncbi:MAG: response regulator [Bacteroides sp.]|jgi:DNA-binding response OmpR family regulator|nr:response regulator [Bacteroides sp.]